MTLSNDPNLARIVSMTAHNAIGQKRKYSHLPYWHHPERVANILYHEVDADDDTLCAAWLHDVVEDTQLSFEDLELIFTANVVQLVREVSDVSKPEDGVRKVRKAIDREHLAKSSYRGASIKLADLIDNVSSIVDADPKFAKVYIPEAEALLAVLQHGNPYLRDILKRQLDKYRSSGAI